MKSLNYSFMSSLCALIIGLLIVVYPGAAVTYLVVAIGVLFLLPGVIGAFSYFKDLSDKNGARSVGAASLVVSLGSLFFGLWLVVMPQFFIGILMYVLGVLLVLCGLVQLSRFVSVRSFVHVPAYMYAISVVVLLAGILVLANPFEVAEIPFVILGVSFMVYALTDLFRLIRYKAKERAEVTDVEIIEETPDSSSAAGE